MKRTIVKPNVAPAWQLGDVVEDGGIRWRITAIAAPTVELASTSTTERHVWRTTLDNLPVKA